MVKSILLDCILKSKHKEYIDLSKILVYHIVNGKTIIDNHEWHDKYVERRRKEYDSDRSSKKASG